MSGLPTGTVTLLLVDVIFCNSLRLPRFAPRCARSAALLSMVTRGHRDEVIPTNPESPPVLTQRNACCP